MLAVVLASAVPFVGAAAVQVNELASRGRALAADPGGIKLAMKCETGCSPKAFCLPPICDGSQKCVTKPEGCDDGDWNSCNNAACPVERRSELCANAKGRVCKQRLGHQEANDRPGDAKVGSEPSENVEPEEPACISIDPLVDDDWCVKSCSTDPMGHPCDPEVCKCGAEVVTERARWKKEKQDKAAENCVGGEAESMGGEVDGMGGSSAVVARSAEGLGGGRGGSGSGRGIGRGRRRKRQICGG